MGKCGANVVESYVVRLTDIGGRYLDGTLDNVGVIATQNGQSVTAETCGRLRRTFWDQDAKSSGEYALSGSDWGFALKLLKETRDRRTNADEIQQFSEVISAVEAVGPSQP